MADDALEANQSQQETQNTDGAKARMEGQGTLRSPVKLNEIVPSRGLQSEASHDGATTPRSTSGLPEVVTSDDELAKDKLLDTVIGTIAAELERSNGRPAEFSTESLARLLQKQAEYVEDVGVYAVRIARRDHLDAVSARHVDEAASQVVTAPQSTRAAVLQTTGGAILGVGGGQLFTVLSTPDPSKVAIVLVVVGLVLGIVLVMLGFKGRR